MNRLSTIVPAMLLVTLFTSVSVAQFANYPAATVVLGQTDFVTTTYSCAQNKMGYVTGISIDPTTGKLFVVDAGYHRVLRFGSAHDLVSGASAEGVLGQTDFVTSTSGVTSSKLNNPRMINIDKNGTMWLADYGNNRVLRFDNVSAKADGAAADAVLGQLDFTTTATSAAQNKTGGPVGVWLDGGGRLWVACFSQHRVLRFDNAASLGNGANADGVLGQSTFTTATANLGGRSATSLSGPNAVYADPLGNLWVCDNSNLRVLKYAAAASKANGAAADVVLGQANFTAAVAATTQNGFNTLRYVSGDQSDNIYVSLENTARVLVFRNASTLGNYANADYVIGQSLFTTSLTTPLGANSLNFPRASVVDTINHELWLCDYNNNRALKYELTSPLPVELTSMTVTSSRLSARLSWSTASEHGNKGFDIECRQVGTDAWVKKGFVAGSGTCNEPRHYSYVDYSAGQGRFAYRIKQIDQEGNATYYGNSEVELGGAERSFALSQGYPNPFNPATKIEFTLAQNANATLAVYNVIGQRVATLFDGPAIAGKIYQREFKASHLPSGLYFARLTSSGVSTMTKLILTK